MSKVPDNVVSLVQMPSAAEARMRVRSSRAELLKAMELVVSISSTEDLVPERMKDIFDAARVTAINELAYASSMYTDSVQEFDAVVDVETSGTS